jgi:hypothetical protein
VTGHQNLETFAGHFVSRPSRQSGLGQQDGGGVRTVVLQRDSATAAAALSEVLRARHAPPAIARMVPRGKNAASWRLEFRDWLRVTMRGKKRSAAWPALRPHYVRGSQRDTLVTSTHYAITLPILLHVWCSGRQRAAAARRSSPRQELIDDQIDRNRFAVYCRHDDSHVRWSSATDVRCARSRSDSCQG